LLEAVMVAKGKIGNVMREYVVVAKGKIGNVMREWVSRKCYGYKGAK
jgi:hypothetical protein